MGLMKNMTIQYFFQISLAAIFGAAIIVLALGNYRDRKSKKVVANTDPVVMLFRDGILVDATSAAIELLGDDIRQLSDAAEVLKSSFPDLQLGNDCQSVTLAAIDNPAVQLDAKIDANIVKLSLSGDVRPWIGQVCEKPADTLGLMQAISTHSPQLVWQEDKHGKVLWGNSAYEAMAHDAAKVVFRNFQQGVTNAAQNQQRVARQTDPDQWFDVLSVKHKGAVLHFANDATALVRADQERRDFVQTLGKTFADLSIGLAIFDKKRQLAMFNPALLDMTNLPVTFLSARPCIDTVLDRLRELRMMPEPKDYASWREQFTAFEAAAKNGTYTENWALPNDQTYRVTGRPHPDGAFAILFEDISAEVSLTRRFRSDIETSQAVLDTLPDAIAVFSGSGTLVTSNAAYARLWSNEPDHLLNLRDLKTEISVWQDRCIASPMWTEMRDFIQRMGGRKPWSETAMLDDGRHLRCHATPIAGGMTMVRFVIAPPMRPVIQKLTQIDRALMATKS
jgi:PAS domain-containing protein